MNKYFRTLAAMLCFAACAASAWGAVDTSQFNKEADFAEHYLKEYEKEVARARGQKTLYRYEREALTRIRSLMQKYPDNPRVKQLFDRARKAAMRSEGDFIEITPAMVQYLKNEEELRRIIWGKSEKEWKNRLASMGDAFLPKTYPTPDYTEVSIDDLKDKYVVIEDVRYPANQFVGATGQYIACGKPSTGYYFINLSGRHWVAPYEAVKRYRRTCDSSMDDVQKWTVLGRITDIASEIPEAGEQKVGSFQFGWIVEPVALMVPGHVASFFDRDSEKQAYFSGESEVKSIKDKWLTVKTIPDNVTPERLMEIFMIAIREKNYDLYLQCIQPERLEGVYGAANGDYFWDLHQERFHREYVHATFGKAKIEVIKGFDDTNDLKNFFLDANQQETLKKTGGEKVEQATVESKAWNKDGRQINQPVLHRLQRKGSGRWYVLDYALRF